LTNLRIFGFRSKVGGLLGVLLFCGGALAQNSGTWKAGQFKELLTGKANRKDIVRVLGDAKPTKSGKLETYSYSDKGEFGGKVLVDVNAATGVVEAVTEQFSPNLTRTQAYKKYGKDYNEVRYSVSECPQEGSTPMVYRDAKGGIELLEYPKKGLILWPNQYGFDIAAAVFRAKALPGKKPLCGKGKG
jgi:hypothetical protein